MRFDSLSLSTPQAVDSPPINLRTRLFWLLVTLAVQCLYFPINRYVQGGVILKTPLDDFVPFWPLWAVPYLLSLPWWTTAYLWAALKMPANLYRAFISAALGIMLTSYLIYIAYPTFIERPILTGTSWEMDLVRFIYNQDRIYNAFPSGHTYCTILITLFWWDWQPRWRWLWGLIAVTILLSTLFTRQHNLPDLAGGAALAYAGYRLGLWWVTRPHRSYT